MKILEEGSLPIYKSSCSYCNTKFEYTKIDLIGDTGIYCGNQRCYLHCPVCLTYIVPQGYIDDQKEI